MVVSLYVLFEILSIVNCLHFLYGKKFRVDKETIILVSIDLFLMQIIYWGILDPMWSVLMYPIIIGYCGVKFGFDIKAMIINNVLCVIILGCLQLCVYFLVKAIFGFEMNTELVALNINIFIFLVVLIILRKCKLMVLSEYLQRKDRIMKIALSITIGVMVGCILRTRWNEGFDLLAYLPLLIFVVLICFITASMEKYKYKMKEAEMELKTYKIYEESFLGLIDDIRARQHEFENHINTIYSQHFLYKTYEELVKAQIECCNAIWEENKYNKLLVTGNSMIGAFLYGKFVEAEKHGIEVSYKINIKNMNTDVPVYKLMELLKNLINNAIEAIETKENASRLFVVMKETDDNIEIEVGNECEVIDYGEIQKYFKKGYSEKGKNRGYGLYNVKKICDTYKMKIECSNKENEGANFLVFKILKSKKPSV